MLEIFYTIGPMLVAFWTIFVARTNQLFPKQKKLAAKRKAKAISSERVKAVGYAQTTSDGRPGKEIATREDLKVPPVYEIYDHPAPPIPLLGASLPSAPIGYGWEICIVNNEHGNPAMKLCLLNLSTVCEVASITADLVVLRRWKYAQPDTYAGHYRKVEQSCKHEITGYDPYYGRKMPIRGKDATETLGKVMMANLITPMVDWARMLVLRYIVDNPDETKCNYLLIESGEKVEVPA